MAAEQPVRVVYKDHTFEGTYVLENGAVTVASPYGGAARDVGGPADAESVAGQLMCGIVLRWCRQ